MHLVYPTPSARQCDLAERLMKMLSKPHTPYKGLATRQLSARLIFSGQRQKAVWRYSRKPEGQEIKNKALQASWKEALVSFITNYHSNQLPDSQRLCPQHWVRCDAVTLLGTVARQRHTCNSSTAASLQGSLNEKRTGRKKQTPCFYTYIEISLNAQQLVNRVWQYCRQMSFLLRVFTKSHNSFPSFPSQHSCLWYSATPTVWGFLLNTGHCRKPRKAVWKRQQETQGKRSDIPRPKQAGVTILSNEPYTHNLDPNFGLGPLSNRAPRWVQQQCFKQSQRLQLFPHTSRTQDVASSL